MANKSKDNSTTSKCGGYDFKRLYPNPASENKDAKT